MLQKIEKLTAGERLLNQKEEAEKKKKSDYAEGLGSQYSYSKAVLKQFEEISKLADQFMKEENK